MTGIGNGDATAMPDQAPRTLTPGVRISIVGTFVILLIGALYVGRALVLPIILAVLIALTFTPLVRYLSRRGVPAALSAVVLVVSIGGAGLGASIILADPVTQMIEDAPKTIRELRQRFDSFRGTVSALVEAGQQVQDMTDPSSDGKPPQKVVVSQSGLLSWAADTLSGIASTLGATLILVVFLLASGDLFLQKLVRVVPTLRDKKRSLRIVHDVESEVSRYLLTITVINGAFGVAVGLAMALLGMPNPILWGVAGALLNYVPYLGAVVGMTLVAGTAIVTYPTLTMAAFPPVLYLALHILEGSVITPLTLGRRLELNAVVILIALALCGWLWGIVGALIAVPLLVVVKVFCDNFPNLAKFGQFLSRDVPPVDTAALEARANATPAVPALRSGNPPSGG
jgi:predicted PurR-regulated permease PerM